MAISKKILDYLAKNKYKYEIIEHRTTYTAWDTSQTEKVKPQEVAKALVLMADKDPVVAVLPSGRNLDKGKLLKIINAGRKKGGEKNYKKLEFAKEAWMKKNIPGKVGAVPPFRGIVGSDIFIDNLLLRNSKIYVGSGEYDASLRLGVSQYLKNEKPVKGNFSMAKK
jgi:prolyl-tRNA editing enzyme YbaK/EbsC (Cys-tRNA(Pro) deacylase)